MPYKRYSKSTSMRRQYRRRYKRLPNVQQTKFFTPRNVASAARYAVKSVNLIKSLVNSELHKHDVAATGNPGTSAGISLLTGTNQGDDVNNRQGNSSLAKYLTFKHSVEMNTSASATIVRFIIFIDTDNDGIAPTAAELLQFPSNINSSINPDYSSRFTILYDKHYYLSINGTRVDGDKFYKPLNFHVKYTGPTGGTDFAKNNIWLYQVSNEVTNVPVTTYTTRFAFYDN